MADITPYWNPGVGGTPATYDIQYRLQDTVPWTLITGLTGGSTTISSLIGGAVYEWQIRAVNAYGTSAWSESKFCPTSPLPGVPTNLACA